jgi:hypothetical protein
MQHINQPQKMVHQRVAYQPQSLMQQSHPAAQQQGDVFLNID